MRSNFTCCGIVHALHYALWQDIQTHSPCPAFALSTENCMVEKSTGLLFVIDFGLSKHVESAVTLGVGTVSLSYCSLSQLSI